MSTLLLLLLNSLKLNSFPSLLFALLLPLPGRVVLQIGLVVDGMVETLISDYAMHSCSKFQIKLISDKMAICFTSIVARLQLAPILCFPLQVALVGLIRF